MAIPSIVLTKDASYIDAIDTTQSFEQDIYRKIFNPMTGLTGETTMAITLIPSYNMQYKFDTWARAIEQVVDTPHIVKSFVSDYYTETAEENTQLYIENVDTTRVQPQDGYAGGLPVAIVVRSGPTKNDPLLAKWEVRHATDLHPSPTYPRINPFQAAYNQYRLMWQVLAIIYFNIDATYLTTYNTNVINTSLSIDCTEHNFSRHLNLLKTSIYDWYLGSGFGADIQNSTYIENYFGFIIDIVQGDLISNQKTRDDLSNSLNSTKPTYGSIGTITTTTVPNGTLLPTITVTVTYDLTSDPNIKSFTYYRNYLKEYGNQQLVSLNMGGYYTNLAAQLDAITLAPNATRDEFIQHVETLRATFMAYFATITNADQQAAIDAILRAAAPAYNSGYYYLFSVPNYNEGYNDINVRRYEEYRLKYYNQAKAMVTAGNILPIVFYSNTAGFDVMIPNDPPPQGASEVSINNHLDTLAKRLQGWFTAVGWANVGIGAATDKVNFAYQDTNIYNYANFRIRWAAAALSYGTPNVTALFNYYVENSNPPANCTEHQFITHIQSLKASYIRWLYRYSDYTGDRQAAINLLEITTPKYVPQATGGSINNYGAIAGSTRKTVIPKNTLKYALEYEQNVATYGETAIVPTQYSTPGLPVTMSVPMQKIELLNNSRFMSTIELGPKTSTLIAGDVATLSSYGLGTSTGQPYIYATIAPSLGVTCTVSFNGTHFIADYSYPLVTTSPKDMDFVDANLAVYSDTGTYLGKAWAIGNGAVGISLKGTQVTFTQIDGPSGIVPLISEGETRTLQFVFTPLYYVSAVPSLDFAAFAEPLLQLDPMPVETIDITAVYGFTDISMSLVSSSCNSITVAYASHPVYTSGHIGVFDANGTFLGRAWDPATSSTAVSSPATITAYKTTTNDIYYLMPATEYSLKYVGLLQSGDEARDIMENTNRLTATTQQLDITTISVESSSVTVTYYISGYTNTLIRIYNDQEQYIGDALVNSDTTVTGAPATITEYVSTNVDDPIQPIQPLTTYWLAPVPLDPTGTPIYTTDPIPIVKVLISTPIPPIVDGTCHCTTAFTAIDLNGLPTPPDPTAAVTGSNPVFFVPSFSTATTTILDASSIAFANGISDARTETNLNGANGFIFKCTVPSFANPYPQGAGTSALRIRIGDRNIDTGKGGNPFIEINFDPNCKNYATVTAWNGSYEICDIGGVGGETLTIIQSNYCIYLFMNQELRGAGEFGASANGWNLSFVGQTSQYYPTTAFILADIVFVEVAPPIDDGVCTMIGTNQVDLTGLGTPPDPLATYTGSNPSFAVMYSIASIIDSSTFLFASNSDFIYSTTLVSSTGFFFQCTIPDFVDPYPQPKGQDALMISLFGGLHGSPNSGSSPNTCFIHFDPRCQNYMDIAGYDIINNMPTNNYTYNIGGVSGDTLTVIGDGSSIYLFINATLKGAGGFPSATNGWGCKLYGYPTGNYPATNFTVENVKFYPYERSLPPQPPQPVPCLVEGTRVLTSAGYRPVETLRRGDKVITADGRLVSARLYRTCVQRTTPETAPYRIPPGLFVGQREELLLSPMHAFQISRGLWEIPKYAATRYPQIRQVCLGEAVNYYHVELPDFFRDHLVINGGVVTESYGRTQCRGLPSDFRLYRFSAKKGGFIRAEPPYLKRTAHK